MDYRDDREFYAWRRPPARASEYREYDRDPDVEEWREWERPGRFQERGYDPDEMDYRRERKYREERGDRGQSRGLMERAADEMRSWFGDEEAERRRQQDEWADRDEPRGRERSSRPREREWDRIDEERWARQWGYIDPSETRAARRWVGYGPSSDTGLYPGVPSESPDWTPRWTPSRSSVPQGPYAGRGPRNFRRSDERIREDVCDRLWQHGGIDASDVDVLVNNGEVTLQGTVDDRGQRRAAEAMAESVWGVQQVQNAIRVKKGLFDRREEYLRDERGRAA